MISGLYKRDRASSKPAGVRRCDDGTKKEGRDQSSLVKSTSSNFAAAYFFVHSFAV